MYLVRLNEKEKEHFYRLAQMAAEANGEIKYEESNYLDLYAKEMSLGIGVLNDIEHITSDDIIQVFSEADNSHKRIVLFETITFMYIDGSFDEEERGFTNRFAELIGIPKEEVDRIVALVEKYVACLKEISATILQE